MPSCKYCNQNIQGGEICVTCYRSRVKRCGKCVDHTGKVLKEYKKGKWVLVYKREVYQPPLSCDQCGNERWVFVP